MGPLTWPDIYVLVETYYREHPREDVWRTTALTPAQVEAERLVTRAQEVPGTSGAPIVQPPLEVKTDFPWQDPPKVD